MNNKQLSTVKQATFAVIFIVVFYLAKEISYELLSRLNLINTATLSIKTWGIFWALFTLLVCVILILVYKRK